MGTIISAECLCGYGAELYDGCGMLGPESCQHIVQCKSCHRLRSVSDDREEPRCTHCQSRKLDRLEFDDESEAPITGLTCPRCGKPTLVLEPGGNWD